MANKYWIGNQTTATLLTANTAANWNTAADGSGSTGVPATGDDCIFGHEDTLKANKGSAVCSWDLAQVNSITTLEDYRYDTRNVSTEIAFDSTANTLTHTTLSWIDLGFRIGMWITISGSSGNSGSFYITNIVNRVMTINSVSANESAGPSITVVSESSINLRTNVALNTLALNGTLKNTFTTQYAITFDGTLGTNNRYITNGDNASILNQDYITYTFGSTGGNFNLDDGPYPKVTLTVARSIVVDYQAEPTSNEHGAVTMYSLVVSNTGASITASLNDLKNDVTKVFKLLTTSTFAYSPSIFNAGVSHWHFKVNTSGFVFPVSGVTNYGAGDGTFDSIFYNVTISTPATPGYKTTIAGGRTLNLNSLTVEGGAVVEGEATLNSNGTSIITSVGRPNIKGAWNFSQLADGIYSSIVTESYPITPPNGPGGRVQLSDNYGKFKSDPALSFAEDTLHVDRGIKITEFADHGTAPGSGYGVLWVKTTTPNTLIFTDENGTDTTLGSGGGGGGGMTSWTLSGDSGSNQTISDGNTVDIAGGTGISTAASATDTVTVTNTGVTSNVAGAGIGVSGATGAVTVSNTGVTSNVAGANIAVSGATGAVTVSAPFPEQPAGAIPAFSIVPDEIGKVPFGWIEVVTVSGQTVFVPAWVAI